MRGDVPEVGVQAWGCMWDETKVDILTGGTQVCFTELIGGWGGIRTHEGR